MKQARLRYALILMVLVWNPVVADTVQLEVAPGINASARYLPGDADKPLLLFIHGFLQTRNFPTVSRLSEALNESGYATLSPNLSLGINNRVESLACEAIHLHTLDQEADEIAAWVEWGKARGHQAIVLIGHSAGSVSITRYLVDHRQPVVSKTILISLTYYGPDRPASFETEAHAVQAAELIARGDSGLADYALSYCEKYITNAASFMSYYRWSDTSVLNALDSSHSDNYIIIGSNDQRISKAWIERLQSVRSTTLVIDGANHFFDQAHEFDLQDAVEGILDDAG